MATKTTPTKTDKTTQSGDGAKAPATPTTEAAPGPTALVAPDNGTKALGQVLDFGDMAGVGVTGDHQAPKALLQVPSLILVSKQSLGVDDKNSPVYGHIGDFYNPITGNVYDGQRGLFGSLLWIEEYYVERKNDSQRTFVGIHPPTSPYVKAGRERTRKENEATPDKYGYGKIIAPEGSNWLVETFAGPACLVPIGVDGKPDLAEAFQAMLAFKSTGIPGLKKWVSGTVLNRRIPGEARPRDPGTIPMCVNMFRIFADPRKEGTNSWHVPLIGAARQNIASSIEIADPDSVGAFLFEEAKALHAMLKSGQAEINMADIDAATADGGEGNGGGKSEAAPTGKKMDF